MQRKEVMIRQSCIEAKLRQPCIEAKLRQPPCMECKLHVGHRSGARHCFVSQAAEELHTMLMNFEMRFACLLIFANKMDLPHSMSVDEITHEVRHPVC
eukprot:6202461-Pleurochrysis_carterae.AAC.2